MSEIIGFIGLGVMGKPMAKHVLAKGFPVVAYNRSRPAVDDVVAAGATAASSPADVAARATIVMTMVPDTPDVERVLTGADGVLTTLRPGSVVIDMSSISPVATRALAAAVEAKGSTMLDAPVSGGEVGAINATLSIMVGGAADALARVQPVLQCMGSRIIHVGEAPGAGQTCKVCNQIAIGGALVGVSEALAVARKAGVDPMKVREALMGGFASSKVLEVHGERLIKKNFVPGFRTRLYQKDLRLATETAAAQGVVVPGTAVVSQLINGLVSAGGGDLDYSALGTILFDLAGLD
jgi:2-hydroxy-3-oxopropionate reductase